MDTGKLKVPRQSSQMNRNRYRLRKHVRHGFTLPEILVVVTIIVILAVFVFQGARYFMAKAEQVKCASNLRQIGIGMQGFVVDNNGFYPTARAFTKKGAAWEGPFWADLIEPYTGSESKESFKHQGTAEQYCYYCPSTELHHGISDYGINPNVILSPTSQNSTGLSAVRITRPSATILAVDAGTIWTPTQQTIGSWTISGAWLNSPPPKPWVLNGPVPRHGNRLNVLFCDGAVQGMTYSEVVELHPDAFEIQ